MPEVIDIEVVGLKALRENLDRISQDLSGAPMISAMRDATMLVTGDARRLAPVDTGRLRASIAPDVRSIRNEVMGIVGSNVVYAPYMELGARAHWPPPGALALWARRHNTTEFTVARAIARRGLKARKFLQGGFEKNKAEIVRRIEQAVGDITR